MALKSFHGEDTIAHSPPAGQSGVPSHINTSVPPVTSQGPEICISSWYPHSLPCLESPPSSPLSHPTPAAADCPESPLPSERSAPPVRQSIPIPRADFLSPSHLCSKSPSCAFSVTLSLPSEQTPPPRPPLYSFPLLFFFHSTHCQLRNYIVSFIGCIPSGTTAS